MITKTGPVAKEIALQSWFRPELTPVGPNKDYWQFHDQIETIGGLLKDTKLVKFALDLAMENCEDISGRMQKGRSLFALKALKLELLRNQLGNPSFREFSRMVCSNDLLADFCGVLELDGIRGVAKSTLERASKFYKPEQVRMMHQLLIELVGDQERANTIGLAEAMDVSVCLVDTTCLETNIHFPVDWVLLRDVTLTSLKAIKLIRKSGLFNRMPKEPEAFAREMNRLCIEMTHSHRKKDSAKASKRILRGMKRLVKTIAAHTLRHRELFANGFAQTDYSEAQAKQIIGRMDAMLAKVPEVIKQAHERIIGGRQVTSAEKILSVYEDDVQLIIRGKAGKRTEFGNTLYIAESLDGLILDWEVYREPAPAEWRQLQSSIDRQEKFDLPTEITAACGDRGFSAAKGSKALMEKEVYDAVCPRNPEELRRRMLETQFAALQRRRGSTEARIATIKTRLGGKLRCKGFNNRYLSVAWSVLGHNFWIVARKIVNRKTLEDDLAA